MTTLATLRANVLKVYIARQDMDGLPRRDERIYGVGAPLLSLAVRTVLDLRVVGLDHVPADGPALLVANHVSFLDPVVLLVLAHRRGRRVRVLAVSEAFTRPVTGYFMRAGGHIPVPDGRGKRSALRAAGAALDAGELVLVYPEGTIAGAQQVPARGGVGFLLARHDVPVVPVGTAGLERGAGRGWIRRPAVAVVGAPITVTRPPRDRGVPREWYDDVSAALLERVRVLVDVAREVVTAQRGGGRARGGGRR